MKEFHRLFFSSYPHELIMHPLSLLKAIPNKYCLLFSLGHRLVYLVSL